ncbi:MAG: hypothetical protein ACR2PM_02745 [Hyphomicrobiales bacterium]
MTSIGRTVPQALPAQSADSVTALNRASKLHDEHLPRHHRHDGAHSKEKPADGKLPATKLKDPAADSARPASKLSDREILNAVRAMNGEQGTLLDKTV